MAGPALTSAFPPVVCRQCALAALRDVKSYLTKEGGQIAVSLGVGGTGTSAFVGPSRTESYCRAALRVEGTSGPKRLLTQESVL